MTTNNMFINQIEELERKEQEPPFHGKDPYQTINIDQRRNAAKLLDTWGSNLYLAID